MKMLTVLVFVIFMSAYASADQMGDSVIYATTYIVRGDSIFVKSNTKILLGEIRYEGNVYIDCKGVEVATFRNFVSPDTLRKLDSIFVDSVTPRVSYIKDSKGKILGNSIMHVQSYHPPVNVICTPPSFSPKNNIPDFRQFNIKGQRRAAVPYSGIAVINRKTVVAFGITK